MLKQYSRKIFIFLKLKFEKLKKGPLRGTPHNLSKVSLEVKEQKRLQVRILLQVNNLKSDQSKSNKSRQNISIVLKGFTALLRCDCNSREEKSKSKT
jgi:hypothetical protein